MCQVSHIRCHVSHVTCNVSRVAFHLSLTATATAKNPCLIPPHYAQKAGSQTKNIKKIQNFKKS